MATSGTWTDPETCPFCGGALPSPGSGFVDHVDDNPDCEDAFQQWRGRIGGDLRGGWSG